VDVEAIVKAQLEDMDMSGMVRQILKEEMHAIIQKNGKDIIEKESEQIFQAEIKKIMFGEGVRTDDGFGDTKAYANFEELFKKALRDRLTRDYDIKRGIEQSIKKMIDARATTISREVITQIVETVTGLQYKKKG